MKKLFLALSIFAPMLRAQTQAPICGQLDTATSTWTTIACPVAAPIVEKAVASVVPPSTPSPSPYPNLWIGFGGAFNGSSTPSGAGWMSVGKLLSRTGPVYSFSSTDYVLVPIPGSKNYTMQSSVRTGIATVVRQWGNLSLMGLGDAGAAMAAKSSGTSLGSAFSGGGMAIYRFGKTGQFTIEAGARVLKTAIGGSRTIAEIGIGYVPSSR